MAPRVNQTVDYDPGRATFEELTRSASEGSVPLMAPARAAVRLSTSSTDGNAKRRSIDAPLSRRNRPSAHAGRLTDQDDYEPALILYHLVDPGKQLLHQFPRLGEPF